VHVLKLPNYGLYTYKCITPCLENFNIIGEVVRNTLVFCRPYSKLNETCELQSVLCCTKQ